VRDQLNVPIWSVYFHGKEESKLTNKEIKSKGKDTQKDIHVLG
jgi:hypothetical protein